MNVAQKVNELLDGLKGKFNGVRCYIDKECTWHQEYAIFTINFHYDLPDFDSDNDYISVEFDVHGLDRDFKNFIEKNLPGCKINHWPNIGEWEIIGPNNSEFYKAHEDELEELAGQDGHHVLEVK